MVRFMLLSVMLVGTSSIMCALATQTSKLEPASHPISLSSVRLVFDHFCCINWSRSNPVPRREIEIILKKISGTATAWGHRFHGACPGVALASNTVRTRWKFVGIRVCHLSSVITSVGELHVYKINTVGWTFQDHCHHWFLCNWGDIACQLLSMSLFSILILNIKKLDVFRWLFWMPDAATQPWRVEFDSNLKTSIKPALFSRLRSPASHRLLFWKLVAEKAYFAFTDYRVLTFCAIFS